MLSKKANSLPYIYLLRFVFTTLAFFVFACGQQKNKQGNTVRRPVIESAFETASTVNGIPKRLLMAVGYLESQLVSTPGSASYAAEDEATGPQLRAPHLTQSAFGIPLDTLGLDPKDPVSEQLETQIIAYGDYIGKILKDRGIKLPNPINSPEELFQWIETLSGIHRKGMTQRRNVQILFARELIETLNRGFVWQDNKSDYILTLSPESKTISLDQFPINARNWFKLSELESSLRLATYLPLVTVSSGAVRDQPRRIEVIHCPLTLSACLELQSLTEDSPVKLNAHYYIHNEPKILSRAVQTADHNESLTLTNPDGTSEPKRGSVILMLVGSSGRIVKGARTPAIPTWFSDQQLRTLGQLINDLCTLFSQTNTNFDRDACMSIGGENGVKFHSQGASEEYTWGMIADFDPTIFEAYIKNPSGLASEVAFDPQTGSSPVQAGQPVTFKTLFDVESRILEVERLSRCENGAVIWEPVRNLQVRNQTQGSFTETFFDSGPNRNGSQFLRVRIYGKDGKLLGWSTQKIVLTKYETEPYVASDKACFTLIK